MKKKIPLFLQIIIGMILGIIFGIIAVITNINEFVIDWIKPWGTIFINLLKLIAIPLIFVSLIKGITSLSDISKLSRIGLKTVSWYIFTTVVAISIGLLIANTINPGKHFPKEKRIEFQKKYSDKIAKKQETAKQVKQKGPLQFIVDIIPENFIKAASDNSKMLQVIFFAILVGIAMLSIKNKNVEIVVSFFDGFNDIILKIIDYIMKISPLGVFALLSTLIVEFTNGNIHEATDLFIALGIYSVTVILGLLIMIFIFYPLLLKFIAKQSIKKFFKAILPAQLMAFSTSSSAATLPVTMECCEKNLKIPEQYTGFVLPVGATVNMDGTSLYQAVAAIFIAQVFGMDLDFMQQLTIVLTATLASIGAAAVPGAGIIMLVIVLNSINVPTEGIALILAIDRILDMMRTVVNVTGDTTITTIIYKTDKTLKK